MLSTAQLKECGYATEEDAKPGALARRLEQRKTQAWDDEEEEEFGVQFENGVKFWVIDVDKLPDEQGTDMLKGEKGNDLRQLKEDDEDMDWPVLRDLLRRGAGSRLLDDGKKPTIAPRIYGTSLGSNVVFGVANATPDPAFRPVALQAAERMLSEAVETPNGTNGTVVESSADEIVCAPDVRYNPPMPYESDQACFTSVDQWDGDLTCPRGTLSAIGARMPDDCIQQGDLIAVVNIFKCYPPRPCAEGKFPAGWNPYEDCPPENALCQGMFLDGEPIETFKADRTWKNSYIWGDDLEGTDAKVEFLGLDPRFDREKNYKRPFNNISMKAMDIAVLYFDFRQVNSFTRLNAGGQGHFDIHIHTSETPEQVGVWPPASNVLPAIRKLEIACTVRDKGASNGRFELECPD
jgi:hypothetical protein